MFFVSVVAEAAATAFVNVNVIPMTEEVVLVGQTVVVEDGQISRLGSVDAVAVPNGATVIDGSDRYLMPGLAEMHAHVTDTAGFDRLATLFVANGVTTIRGMLGRKEHLSLRDRLRAGRVFGPRLVTSGPSLNGRSVSGIADAARQVRAQHSAGYDFIKVHPGLSADEFDSMAKTANEIGMRFAGHVPAAAGVRRALELDIATIDHLDGYFAALMPSRADTAGRSGGFFSVMLADRLDGDQITSIARQTAAAGTWNVPTETLIEQLIDTTPPAELSKRPEMRYVSRATVDNWVRTKENQLNSRDFDPAVANRAIALRRRLILELHKADAGLLLGSDAPQTFNVPGFSVHRELQTMVDAGLTPFEALRIGTVAVGDFLDANTGTIAPGRDADLVLLDGNPLLEIRNSQKIHGVMLRGQWLSRSDLDSRLAQYLVD